MSAKNSIRIDLTGNADLKNYFASKGAGDAFDFHVSGILTEKPGESAVGSLTEVELPGGDEGGEPATPTKVKPDGMNPTAMSMDMME